MPTKLVLLCGGTKPHPYFNVLAHAIDELDVEELVFFCLEESPTVDEEDALAAQVRSRLIDFIPLLERGKYVPYSSNAKKPKPVDIEQEDIEALRSLDFDRMKTLVRRSVVVVADEDSFSKKLTEQASSDTVFDLTGGGKGIAAGATAWLVSRGSYPVRTLEILAEQRNDIGDLVPILKDYRYKELDRTPLIKESMRRVNRLSMERRMFVLLAIVVALAIGSISSLLSDTMLLSVLTGLAAFASIMSALAFFVRE